jgi:putative oxidoreductase
MEAQGVPFASITAPLGAAVEFLGGLAVILGAWTTLSAILVAGFTVVATLIAHRFWEFPVEQQKMQNLQFMKNLTIIGGLLALACAGGGRLSVDNALRRRARAA